MIPYSYCAICSSLRSVINRRFGTLIPAILINNETMKSIFKLMLLTGSCISNFSNGYAQNNSDEAYRKPLKEVLKAVEDRYGVQIKYADSLVNDKWVPYADWRFRGDLETTL